MSLRIFEYKPTYDSDEDNILQDFYIHALSESVRYDRIAGYFCSTSFVLAASGLASFIKNNGKMRLIFNVEISTEDYDAITAGLSTPDKFINDPMMNELDTLRDRIVKDHLKVLSWMVATGCLELRVAILQKRPGIFHQKTGIMYDRENNFLSFSGTENETANGWKYNVEELKVFVSWNKTQRDYLETDIKRFEKFWESRGKRTLVIDFPTAVTKRLLELRPANNNELQKILERIEHYITKSETSSREPRDYQGDALSTWSQNGTVGLFEMATGTGKTLTAIFGLRDLLAKESMFVVIACPYSHLVNQWIDELEKEGLKAIQTTGKSNWKDKVKNVLLDIDMSIKHYGIVVTTYNTMSNTGFIELVESLPVNKFLICDEAHWVGTRTFRKGLLEDYKYRLGLTATPTRYFDDEGTQEIANFFNCILDENRCIISTYSYPLEKAIGKWLTPYEYHTEDVYLTEEELSEYKSYGQKIARLSARTDEEGIDAYERLLTKRVEIITNANNKLDTLDNLLHRIVDIDLTLIYCSPAQIDKVCDLLTDHGVIFSQFTGEESPSERIRIINSFEKKDFSVLVAMRCLDEGVDIPAVKCAIILASSGNSKQFVQRRGRILRKHPNKEFSIIYDFLVLPNDNEYRIPGTRNVEKSIIRREIRRARLFARLSMNPLESMQFLSDIADEYRIPLK